MESRGLYKQYALAIATAVVIALLIRMFVIEAYRIPSGAMRPTLEPGDTIFVSKLSYSRAFGGRELRRGDVVIFSPLADPSHDYIKRVIGLPGDAVRIQGNQLFLNGKQITAEPAPGSSNCGTQSFPEGPTHLVCWEPPKLEDFGPETVPEKTTFVLGDLRTQITKDVSKPKSWGMIPETLIKGKAVWIWLSIDPQAQNPTGFFPRFRFDRMFRRIE